MQLQTSNQDLFDTSWIRKVSQRQLGWFFRHTPLRILQRGGRCVGGCGLTFFSSRFKKCGKIAWCLSFAEALHLHNRGWAGCTTQSRETFY